MCAIAGERGAEELVVNLVGKWCAEDGDGGGENEAGPIGAVAILAQKPDGFEKMARAIHVDPVTFLERDLGFSGDDGGEMKDHIRLFRSQSLHCLCVGDIACLCLNLNPVG